MDEKNIKELVINYLQKHCKNQFYKVADKIGIHHTVNESFGAIVLLATTKFLEKKEESTGYNYPKLLLVDTLLQYVVELPVQYEEIDKIERIILTHTEHKTTYTAGKYNELLELIRRYYPNHPVEKVAPTMKQEIINNPINMIPDSLDFD